MQDRDLNNEERERLVRCISDCQRVMDECPHADNGWRNCGTCGQMESQIEEYHEAILALNSDEASESDRVLDPYLPAIEVKVRKLAEGNTLRLNRLFQLKTEFASQLTELKEDFQREQDQLSNLRRTEASELADMLGLRNISGESEEQRLEAETVITVPQV